MKNRVFIVLLSLLILSSCGSSKSQTNEISILKEANEIAKVLQTRDLKKISKVCTEQGFKSILDWTDSLNNDKLFTVIINKLSSRKMEYSMSNSGTYNINIKVEEMNDGNNVGEITIVVKNGKAKIDSYSGGISFKY
jgi:hypothetical protein